MATATLQVMPALGCDPKWNRARELLQSGRQTAIAFRAELERLREIYCGEGHGGDRRSQDFKSLTGETLGRDAGFRAAIERELGISPATAYRLLERSEHQERIERVATAKIGAVIAWREKDKEQTLEVTEERQALARKAVASWALPQSPKPSRSWAGICGEGERVANGGKDRAPVEPGKQLCAAFRSIQKWAPYFDGMSIEDQALVAAVARDAGLPHVLDQIVGTIAKLKPKGRP